MSSLKVMGDVSILFDTKDHTHMEMNNMNLCNILIDRSKCRPNLIANFLKNVFIKKTG